MNGFVVGTTVLGRVATTWGVSGVRARVAWLLSIALVPFLIPRGVVPGPAWWGVAVAGGLLATGAFVDLAERRIPNALTAAALLAVFAGVGLAGPAALARAVAGLVIAAAPLAVVHLRRGVGLGDVKMAAAIGASCGAVSLTAAPVAIVVAAVLAAAYGRAARRAALPLGPFLWLGWAAALAGSGR